MKKIETKSNKLNFFGSMFTAFLLMVGTASFAQERENVGNSEVDEFNQYDENSDQQLDRNEFNNWIYESGAYDQLDKDRSGAIDQNEFSEAMLIIFGLDRNQSANNNTQSQQNQGMNTQDATKGTTGTMEPGTFQDWDKDRSGTIDQTEYDEAVLIIYGVSPVNTTDQNQGTQDTQNTETEMNNTNSTETEMNNNNNGTETEMNNTNTETEINDNSSETEINKETETEMDTNSSETEIKEETETGTEVETETDTEVETEVGTEY